MHDPKVVNAHEPRHVTYSCHACSVVVQLVGERDVRAVVKLKFRNITGQTVICHRMLQALQKVRVQLIMHFITLMCVCVLLQPKKLEVRTIDTSLEKIKDGQVNMHAINIANESV